MKCVRPCCRKEIPDGASFCPWCGKKQPEAAPQQRKKRRRPKGSGSVYKLSGTRSKPYVALRRLSAERTLAIADRAVDVNGNHPG